MKVTIVYMTGRQDPKIEWTLDGLVDQMMEGDEVELLVIDALGRDEKILKDWVVRRPNGGLTILFSMPKPNIWQGPHRVTSADWWATANARNTAIAIASKDYIAFMDDRSYLGPKWLETVRKGYGERRSVIVGSYEKHEDGRVTQDHRRSLKPEGLENCGGGWLYGCSFAMPLEWCLEANGLEEGCDGLTGEDYIFGLMLANNGHRIDFVPELFVSQNRDMGTEHGYKMTDKGVSPKDKSHAALDRFGKRKYSEFTPNLRELRNHLQAGGRWVLPDKGYDYRDWYDGQLIREMV